MKKLILTGMLACLFAAGFAQVDTLYTKNRQKIPCKITEISEQDIRYKKAELPEGPVFVINKTSVIKYKLSNGYEEIVVPDELSIEHEHELILKNRSVLKVSPFSPVNQQITVAYEKVLKIGMNLDVELSYSNSNINGNSNFDLNNSIGRGNAFNTGVCVKPGVKFFLGQDYSVKGMKYAHPLKGRYIRLDLAVSYLNFQNVTRTEYLRSATPPYTQTPITVRTNISSVAYGGFVNYGRQFILANTLTLEYYVGIGFSGQANAYSNPDYTKPVVGTYYYSRDDAKYISNYHGFFRETEMGISATAGFRIGYIIPDKSLKKKENAKH